MRIKSTHINLGLILFAIIAIVIKSVELVQSIEKRDAIIRSLEYKENRLENSVQACEIISEVKSCSPRYTDLHNRLGADSSEKYWNLRNKIYQLNYKLMILCSHSSTVLDDFLLIKDKISNNVYLGTYDIPLILCDAHSVQINKEVMPYHRFMNYRMSKKKSLEIEYQRYTLNFDNGEVDTVRIRRFIDKKSMVKIR